MNLNTAIRSASNGLSAERLRMDVISANIANANSVETPTTEPYRRKDVVMQGTETGPKITQIVDDSSTPLKMVYQPGNTKANNEGKVRGSNVEPILEMVNMMSASRAYEANVAAFNTVKQMLKNALNIGKV